MAELRQFAHTGKEIDEAVEKVENGTVYEGGVGIDIANGKISVDDIPNVTLNTPLTEEVISWVEKGYPIYYSDIDYTLLYHFNTNNGENIIFTASVPAGANGNNYPILLVATLIYNIQSKTFVSQSSIVVSTPSTSFAGFIKLGSNAIQTEVAQQETTTEGRTYPVQLDEYGRAVVNVPWIETVANPTLEGGESALSSLEIGGTKYSVGDKLYLHSINISGGYLRPSIGSASIAATVVFVNLNFYSKSSTAVSSIGDLYNALFSGKPNDSRLYIPTGVLYNSGHEVAFPTFIASYSQDNITGVRLYCQNHAGSSSYGFQGYFDNNITVTDAVYEI